MTYFLGQVCGILATIACITVPMCKTKCRMLADATAVNFLMCMNYILIGQVGAAAFVAFVATVQSTCSLIHTLRKKEESHIEKGLFLILYLVFGFYGVFHAPDFELALTVHTFVQFLPVLGSMLNMCFVYTRNEKTARWFLLATNGVWALYSAAVGAASFFGQFFTVLSASASIYRYREKAVQE